ncbi:MAG: DnaB-like helicase C-terminal domain-containing protein, partial [Pseudonocardia sp.]
HDIDELTGGMRLGQFIVIAGRPGHGKTTVGAQVARNVAHQGIATEIFSLEMPKEELGQRNASAETGIPFEDIRDGRVDAEAIERLIEYDASQANYPMTVDDDPGQTLGEIALKVRKSAREKGAKVFVIDYLQLVKPDKPTGNPTVDVAIVSEGLRRLARTLRVIIIALAQLNRESAGRDDGKPKLTDLRQSGQIEQDANVVILVHLPFKIDPDTARGKEADLILAKNRGGKTAERVMLFDGAHSRFLNPSDVQPRFAA